jgi:hypothetical protein
MLSFKVTLLDCMEKLQSKKVILNHVLIIVNGMHGK